MWIQTYCIGKADIINIIRNDLNRRESESGKWDVGSGGEHGTSNREQGAGGKVICQSEREMRVCKRKDVECKCQTLMI